MRRYTTGHALFNSNRLTGRLGFCIVRLVETYNVVNVVAALTIAMVVVRAIQAGVEHYWPNSDPAGVLRFIYGGP